MDASPASPHAASTIEPAANRTHFRYGCTPTLAILLGGLAYHAHLGGPSGLATNLVCVLIGSVNLIGLYLLGEVGVGEIKLMAGAGAWLGLPFSLHLFAAGSLILGLHVLILMSDHAIDIEAMFHPPSRRLRSP